MKSSNKTLKVCSPCSISIIEWTFKAYVVFLFTFPFQIWLRILLITYLNTYILSDYWYRLAAASQIMDKYTERFSARLVIADMHVECLRELWHCWKWNFCHFCFFVPTNSCGGVHLLNTYFQIQGWRMTSDLRFLVFVLLNIRYPFSKIKRRFQFPAAILSDLIINSWIELFRVKTDYLWLHSVTHSRDKKGEKSWLK